MGSLTKIPLRECRWIGRSIRFKTGDADNLPLEYLGHVALSLVCYKAGGSPEAVGKDSDLSAVTRELARRSRWQK